MVSFRTSLIPATALTILALSGCATVATESATTTLVEAPTSIVVETTDEAVSSANFEQDRDAILAMVGDYKVTFDFTETVSFVEGYELKEPKLSGGHESVRIVEDRGDYISLQHLLVVGSDESPYVVKHWRQDWQYEPARVLTFIGGNAWEWKDVPASERAGTWSQTVYQVDDSPRYGAVGSWDYEDGIAEWTPPKEWRPLPRRDMTTRDDYHAVDAVNRHAITPWGWVHEQDNSKLMLHDEPKVLVREVGVNTYRKFDDYPVAAADEYWAATETYWAGVRDEWNKVEAEHDRFAISIEGETTALYMPLLMLASEVKSGEKEVEPALAEVRDVIAEFVTPEIGTLADRLRPTTTLASLEE
ncbi:MAG: DUF6607 family protein [Pseudomonadota bacterium]